MRSSLSLPLIALALAGCPRGEANSPAAPPSGAEAGGAEEAPAAAPAEPIPEELDPTGTLLFDWKPDRTLVRGRVRVVLERLAALPRSAEALAGEPLAAKDKAPGAGTLLVAELSLFVDGTPLAKLPEGVLVATGPWSVRQEGAELAGLSAPHGGEGTVPLPTRPASRYLWRVVPPIRSDGPFHLQETLTLKGGEKVTVELGPLLVPAAARRP